MEDARKLGSSLLLMSTWYQYSKYVLYNPKYTNKFVSSRNIDLKKFKRKPLRNQYVKDTIVTFVGNQLKTPKRSQSKASDSSYLKLLESDYESNDGDAASHSNDTSSESNATSHSDGSNARKVRKRYRNSAFPTSSSSSSNSDEESPRKVKKSGKGKRKSKVTHKSKDAYVSTSESEEEQVRKVTKSVSRKCKSTGKSVGLIDNVSTVDVQSEVNLPVEEDSNKKTNKKRKKSRKNSPQKDTTVTVAKGKKHEMTSCDIFSHNASFDLKYVMVCLKI